MAKPEPPPIPDRLLYSYAEARALLGGVPSSTFDLWLKDGVLHPVRIGRRRAFIPRDEILRLAQTLPKAG